MFLNDCLTKHFLIGCVFFSSLTDLFPVRKDDVCDAEPQGNDEDETIKDQQQLSPSVKPAETAENGSLQSEAKQIQREAARSLARKLAKKKSSSIKRSGQSSSHSWSEGEQSKNCIEDM